MTAPVHLLSEHPCILLNWKQVAGVFARINANKNKQKNVRQTAQEMQDTISKEIEENEGDEDLTYQDDNMLLDDFDLLKHRYAKATLS